MEKHDDFVVISLWKNPWEREVRQSRHAQLNNFLTSERAAFLSPALTKGPSPRDILHFHLYEKNKQKREMGENEGKAEVWRSFHRYQGEDKDVPDTKE